MVFIFMVIVRFMITKHKLNCQPRLSPQMQQNLRDCMAIPLICLRRGIFSFMHMSMSTIATLFVYRRSLALKNFVQLLRLTDCMTWEQSNQFQWQFMIITNLVSKTYWFEDLFSLGTDHVISCKKLFFHPSKNYSSIYTRL